MDNSIKIIIYGTTIAAAVSTICAITNNINMIQHDQNLVKLEREVSDLQAQCVAESEETKAKLPGTVICDPNKLKGLKRLGGVQTKLGDAQQAVDVELRNGPLEWPYVLSVVIVITSVLPWSWYFLLRRIRELSDALRGR